VTLNVSRLTVTRSDGKKPCAKCGRPVTSTRRGGGRGAPQSYCHLCKAQYERDRRAGMVEVLLTPEEWHQVKQARYEAAYQERNI
jgi:hypothetical protein